MTGDPQAQNGPGPGPGMVPGIGFSGKHPGFGDFIGLGLDPALRHALDQWLEAELPGVAGALGAGWEQVWQTSPGLGFWIGGQVLAASGGAALRGWLLPSHDRVGRRWPFLVVQHPAPGDPPTRAGDDGFAAAACAAGVAARALRPADLAGFAPVFAPLAAGGDGAAQAVPPQLWAVNPKLSGAALWAELAAHDHRRAASLSSYFWAEPGPGRAAAVLACPGLPGGAALAWLLAGAPEAERATAPAGAASDDRTDVAVPPDGAPPPP